MQKNSQDRAVRFFKTAVVKSPAVSSLHQKLLRTMEELQNIKYLIINLYGYLYYKYIRNVMSNKDVQQLLFFLNPRSLPPKVYKKLTKQWCDKREIKLEEFIPFDVDARRKGEGELEAVVILNKYLDRYHTLLMDHLFATLLAVPNLEAMLPIMPEAMALDQIDKYIQYEHGSIQLAPVIVQFIMEEVESHATVLLLKDFSDDIGKPLEIERNLPMAIAVLQLFSTSYIKSKNTTPAKKHKVKKRKTKTKK